ncbi:arylsulfotransferase family protein [Bounagaea algeriensis]
MHAADGYRTDLHELRTTPQDTALVGIYAPVVMDLSDVGGRPNTTVYDYVVQEVDIATGAKLFERHALDHLDIRDYQVPVPTDGRPYDWIHGNSVGLDRDGNLLTSARRTWTYKLDRRTGEVMWIQRPAGHGVPRGRQSGVRPVPDEQLPPRRSAPVDRTTVGGARRRGSRDGARAMTVFASWNGATEVTDWQIVAGDRVNTLDPVGAPKSKAGSRPRHPKAGACTDRWPGDPRCLTDSGGR